MDHTRDEPAEAGPSLSDARRGMTAYVVSLVLLAAAVACFVLGYAADGLMLVWTSIGLSAASALTWVVFITRRAARS